MIEFRWYLSRSATRANTIIQLIEAIQHAYNKDATTSDYEQNGIVYFVMAHVECLVKQFDTRAQKLHQVN